MLKNSMKVLMIIICLVTIAILYCVVQADNKAGDVMVYFVNTDVFNEFLDNPSEDMLKNNPDVEYAGYSISDNKPGYIRKEIMSCNPAQIQEGEGGWYMSIGGLPVYDTLIDFVGNKENVKNYLVQNGVRGEIENMFILCGDFPEALKIPVTMWVKVDGNNYFIAIEKEIVFDQPDNKEYLYKFYTDSEYKDKFGAKNGVLCVNGKDISAGNYVKFQNCGAYLPFRAVMENLGAKVEWDADTGIVLLTCDDARYIMKTRDGLSLFEEGQPWDLLAPPPGSTNAFTYRIINDRIIMDNQTMQTFLSLMNAQINIDCNSLTVNITQQ